MTTFSPQDLDSVKARIAALGANFNTAVLEATQEVYRPLLKTQPPAAVEADIAYGAHARQKLDLYKPATVTGATIVFIPGGGFIGGDKNADGTFYCNIGRYFAAHGHLTIIANYRLAPDFVWPSGAEDVAGVMQWAHRNIARFGGDPARLVLFGQSAGAAHAAGYLFNPALQPDGASHAVACVLMSGVYRVTENAMPNVKLYYGSDAATYAERSPITHIAKTKVPLLLSVAEFDPAPLAAPTYDLASAATWSSGKSPQLAYFAGHNHVSTVMSLGSGQDDAGAALRAFIGRF